jgi:hypothetical protein
MPLEQRGYPSVVGRSMLGGVGVPLFCTIILMMRATFLSCPSR